MTKNEWVLFFVSTVDDYANSLFLSSIESNFESKVEIRSFAENFFDEMYADGASLDPKEVAMAMIYSMEGRYGVVPS